jgi:hypothetical protein
LFSIGVGSRFQLTADFDSQRLARHALERRRMSRRRPQLQLGVARRPQLQQIVVSAIVQLEAGDGLGVAAIQAFGEPQDR